MKWLRVMVVTFTEGAPTVSDINRGGEFIITPFLMKLYYKNDPKIISKHKKVIRWWQDKTGMSDYQLLWASFIKGLIIGLIIL